MASQQLTVTPHAKSSTVSPAPAEPNGVRTGFYKASELLPKSQPAQARVQGEANNHEKDAHVSKDASSDDEEEDSECDQSEEEERDVDMDKHKHDRGLSHSRPRDGLRGRR